MTVKWDGTKLLKTIIANEESTAKLYRAIAENAHIGAKFFDILAADEERHKMIYEALLVQYADKLGMELDEAYSEYVDLLIRRNVVFDNKLIEDAKTIDRRDQILEIAERAERDAILFVSELQKMYPIMAKEEMAIILNEERKHLKMVLEKQELQQPYIRGL
ncbi:MAG: ferritin family protein [Acidaminococcaceae bacterium]